MKINVHAGHNKIVPGASSILNEVTEDRKVKNKVVSLLKAEGHTVYDCTDDSGKTKYDNLGNIVKKCNAHTVDLDVSIHLNAGRNDKTGDGKTGGVEIWIKPGDTTTKKVAERICKNVAKELGITNRGVKENGEYYVIKNTKSNAMIIECCFVDDKDDANKWNADKCGKAIAEGIVNKTISTTTTTSTSSSTTTSNSSSSFLVKVANVNKGDRLNIRKSADASSKITGKLEYNDPNKYTIVQTKKVGTETWGKLKSGVGWINLRYTKKV